MKLSAVRVRNAAPQEKAYKLFDGGGLFLLVHPNGGKYWRFKYRLGGRHKTLALGVYPDISLKDARDGREAARKQLARGIDPAAARRAEKLAQGGSETFEVIAREWFDKHSPRWAPSHSSKVLGRLEKDVFPWLGATPINQITAPEILRTLRRIESRGTIDTAHRAKQHCSQVFRYAIATGRADRDPTADLRGALPPAKAGHFAAITEPKAVGALLRAIDGYSGAFVTKCALRLAPLVFVRPGELRAAQWSELDLDGAEWRIPAERMKMDAPHIVPLAAQAVAILRELYPLTGRGKYVFPGVRSPRRPMSENTITAALRRLGYSGKEMTAHGFRSMASTLLNEQGWNRDAIERQLAHAERNSVRAAYNYAEYLPERRKMMQAWADYLDTLKAGAAVIPIGAGRGK